MASYGIANNTGPTDGGICSQNRFYSVEFQVDNIKFMYQFKIWTVQNMPPFVLVKENSDILNAIHAGDVLSMTYYSENTARPKQQRPTKILAIEREENGRFRGHYLVSLGIFEN